MVSSKYEESEYLSPLPGKKTAAKVSEGCKVGCINVWPLLPITYVALVYWEPSNAPCRCRLLPKRRSQ